MDLDDRLEELRGLLYQGPSPGLWERLCALLDRWPEDQSPALALDYAAQALERWDDGLRTAPMRWARRLLLEPQPARGWPLVRTLSLQMLAQDDRLIQRMLRRGLFAGLRALDLSHRRLRADTWSALFQSPDLAQITWLRAAHVELNASRVAHIARAPALVALRELDLSGNRIGVHGAAALASVTRWERLERASFFNALLHPDAVAAALQAPWMGTLRELDLSSNDLRARATAALVDSPPPRQLRKLNLSSCRLSWENLKLMRDKWSAPALEELSLSQNWLGAQGLEALAASPWAANLRALGLSRVGMTEVTGLLSPSWRGLRRLDLSGNALSAGALGALGASRLAEPLEALDLSSGGLDGAGLEALLSGGALRRLRHLSLREGRLGQGRLEALGRLDALPALESLDLSTNPLGPGGALALSLGEPPPRLQTLTLAQTGLTDEAAEPLAALLEWPSLEALDLSRNHLGAAAARLLGKGKSMVTKLSLSQNPLGDEGLERLLSGPLCGDLRELSLVSCRIGDRGARALLQAPWLRRLVRLELSHNQIGAALEEEFSRRDPGGGDWVISPQSVGGVG